MGLARTIFVLPGGGALVILSTQAPGLEINRESRLRERLKGKAEEDTIFFVSKAVVPDDSSKGSSIARHVTVDTVLLVFERVVISFKTVAGAKSPVVAETGVGLYRVEVRIPESRMRTRKGMVINKVVTKLDPEPVCRHETDI